MSASDAPYRSASGLGAPSRDPGGAPSPLESYPLFPELVPDFEIAEGRYRCRFARDVTELERVLRLRYEVFNLELGEGLDASRATGLDRDRFDPHCHHLLVEDVATGGVVGTYRLQVAAMAAAGHGFYTAGEFRIEAWPPAIREQAVEIGRACIAREHRRSHVLLILWKGLGAYAIHNRKRYFFGCCSITSQDPAEAARVLRFLKHRGCTHPDLPAEPQPDYECGERQASDAGWEQTRIPPLFRTYLRYGAMICGRPALDREFKTIDFLALLDLGRLDPAQILRQFEVDIRVTTGGAPWERPPHR